jgi:hypothetical protein
MSALCPYSSPLMISGGIKYGVPKKVLAKSLSAPKFFDIPKSPNLIMFSDYYYRSNNLLFRNMF